MYKQAVYNMCKTCIYDPLQKGSWLQQVRNCTSSTCPLFGVRPGNDSPKRKLTLEHLEKLKQNRERISK